MTVLSSRRSIAFAAGLLALLLAFGGAAPLLAGGTPDPSNVALSTTNRNSLIGVLGPDRGFGFGDYVTDRVSGLQRGGAVETYDYYIEVPPGQTQLVVQIFDADAGAADNLGTPAVNEDLHDQDNTTAGWGMVTTYQLFDPAGTLVASRVLAGQDCDPGVAGLQNFCDNIWSDLGAFTVASPVPGHWRMEVGSPNSGLNDEDDANSFGLRAHDGDATAGGNEFPIYANTYIGLGQVYAANAGADPGFSRISDLFPYVRRDCSCDSNDWDSDSTAPIDESTVFATRTGATPTGSNGTLSGATVWRQNVLSGFATGQNANDYGLWRLRYSTGRFNFLGFYMGDETAADPSNAAPGPGNGQEPNQQPEAGAIRLYFPADGSRFFGLPGGPNDVVVLPLKPWVGQSWALLAGQPPIEAGVTSIVRVTVTVANPTAYPIQLSAATAGPQVITVTVPNNGGQVTYVGGSATITGGSSTDTSVAGAGPWTITYAPGVIAAGVTATLTYDVSVTPTAVGLPKTLFFTGSAATGTAGSLVDETCANGAGGASVCSAPALAGATLAVGPLCQLSAPVTTAPSLAVSKRINGVVADNGNGTFTVPFRLVVENLGTNTITPLQVVDNLAATFPAPAAVVGVTVPTTSILTGVGTLSANAGFNGVGNTNLLNAGGSSLNSGASGQIDFSVTFDPNGLPGPFFNQATTSGTTTLGGTVGDSSDDGADPDPDGDGNGNEPGTGCPSTLPATNCENDPTPVAIGENPVIGVSKAVSGPVVSNGNGTFTVNFDLRVENLGNVDLTQLQVSDNLLTTFPAPAAVAAVSAVSVSLISGTGVLTANGSYNGTGNNNLLLAASSSLAVGAVGQITFSVTFDPNSLPGPFNNQALATAQSPQGATVTDLSDNGLDPDPNGNGDPDEPGENDPTPVGVPEAPELGIAKQVNGAVISNGNGTFTVAFRLRLENLGNVDLTSVQAIDNLAATFPAPASVVSVTAPTTSIVTGTGVLTANPGYTGTGVNNLLVAASSSLTVGAVGQIDFSVTFDPNGQPGPFNNQATGSGVSPLGTTVTDLSDDGADPDPDGDGNPDEPGENDPTPVGIGELPEIGVAKRVNGPIADNGDGTYTVNFVLVVENLGNVDLDPVAVEDDLAATFPAPVSITAVTPPTASILTGTGTFTANAGYNGVGDIQLLVLGSSLDVASSGQISFAVTFDPNGQPGPFNNQAEAFGQSPGDVTVTDLSDDGTDPDPDGDGNPDEPGENDPTPVTVPTVSANAIGVAKDATELTDNGDGTFTVTFLLTVENLGNLALDLVQVTDDLAVTFPAPSSVTLVTAPTAGIVSGTGTLTANPAYDGSTDINLLVAATSDLDPGAIGEIEFSVTFDPADLTQFFNSATASGSNNAGTVTDTSDDGTEPDADGDGNPDEPGENDPTPFGVGGPIVEVPVLDYRGLLLLAGLLLAAGFLLLRRGG
jgi:hypothetical protein